METLLLNICFLVLAVTSIINTIISIWLFRLQLRDRGILNKHQYDMGRKL